MYHQQALNLTGAEGRITVSRDLRLQRSRQVNESAIEHILKVMAAGGLSERLEQESLRIHFRDSANSRTSSFTSDYGLCAMTTLAFEKVERLQSLYNNFGPPDEIKSLKAWLLAHPSETVAAIAKLKLYKFDVPIAEVIANIGPPVANVCLPQLLGLVADINWPVYAKACEALTRFSWPLILEALAQLVDQREIEDVSRFCLWVRYTQPSLVGEVRQFLAAVIAQPGHHEIDLENAHEALADIDESLGTGTVNI